MNTDDVASLTATNVSSVLRASQLGLDLGTRLQIIHGL